MDGNRLHILHFAYLINEDDFIDVIVKAADKKSFKISVCTCVGEGNIKSVDYNSSSIKHLLLNTELTKIDFFKSVFRLIKILRSEKIDIIHSHHYYECLIAAIAGIVTGTKLVITRHYHNELYLTTNGLKLKLYLGLEKLVNQFASIIISPSSLIRDLLIEQGVSRKKILTIPYGFDFSSSKYARPTVSELIETRMQFHFTKENFLIGNFARHHSIKGQDLLLKAFAQVLKRNGHARLVMVGDGPFHETLVNMAVSLNIASSVVFLGWQRNIRLLLSCVDVVIQPTHQEAYPQIMVEALALEKLLLITPVSGATDLIEQGVNGVIIPFGEPKNWAETLEHILKNRSAYNSMIINGRKTVLNKLNISEIIMEIEKVYFNLSREK
jgi:glycosyltransferase involved in cell wall biosynthesis